MWMLFVSKHWKTLLGLLLAVGLGLGGFYYGRQSVKPIVQQHTVIQEKIVKVEVEKIVKVKDTTTTIEKRPDGTEITTIEEHEKIEHDKKTDLSQETHTDTKPTSKNYKVGTFLDLKPWNLLDKNKKQDISWGLSASTRVFSSVWLDTTYNFDKKTATFGTSWEF